MSELVIAEKNDLVNIANEIRQLTGQTEGLNLQEMQTELKSIDNQPDWNQNDPNAKNYIKNRPGGYAVAPSFEITWDGDTTGKETVDAGNGITLVKIADEAPPIEKFAVGSDVATFDMASGPSYAAVITADVEYGNGNHETKQAGTELQSGNGFWICGTELGTILGVTADQVSIGGMTFTKGLWFTVYGEANK